MGGNSEGPADDESTEFYSRYTCEPIKLNKRSRVLDAQNFATLDEKISDLYGKFQTKYHRWKSNVDKPDVP